MDDEGNVTPLEFLHQQRAAIAGFLKSLESACQTCEGSEGGQSRAILETEGRRAVLFLEQQADEWRSQLQLEAPEGAGQHATTPSPTPPKSIRERYVGPPVELRLADPLKSLN